MSVSCLLKFYSLSIAFLLVWYHIGTLIFLKSVLPLVSVPHFLYRYLEFSWIRYLVLYRYLSFCIGTLTFLEFVPRFVSVPSHIIINPVPHSNLPDPSGGSVIYESGTGKMILLLSFLEGTDPKKIFFCSDPMIEFYSGSVLFLLQTHQIHWPKNTLRILVFFYGSVLLDLSFWCCRPFGSTIFYKFCARILTPTLVNFLAWGDYRCPRPGLDFYSSFRSETLVLNSCVAHFFIWRRDP